MLREEGKVDDGEDVEMKHHHPDNELTRLETLGGEQQLGEKPPCLEYMREEENTQLLFHLGKEVDGGQLILLYRVGGGGEQLLQLFDGGGEGLLLQLCEGGSNEQLLQL